MVNQNKKENKDTFDAITGFSTRTTTTSKDGEEVESSRTIAFVIPKISRVDKHEFKKKVNGQIGKIVIITDGCDPSEVISISYSNKDDLNNDFKKTINNIKDYYKYVND